MPRNVVDEFVGRQIAVRVVIGVTQKLRLEYPSARTLEFTIDGAAKEWSATATVTRAAAGSPQMP